jgi:hypothetical protein
MDVYAFNSAEGDTNQSSDSSLIDVENETPQGLMPEQALLIPGQAPPVPVVVEQSPVSMVGAFEEESRTLVSDLREHLNDAALADVVLRGTDDGTVVAVRSILAMRSRFFKSLLFGSFQESNLREVPLGYSSLVLKAVLEYCYTDEIGITFENHNEEETARSMVGLVAAGNYFELGGLLSRAYRLTLLMIDEYPALACSVLDESISGNNQCAQTQELGRFALGMIRRTESALLPPDTYGSGVQSLGEAALELVMSDHKIQANELKMFFCLKKWADHVPQGEDAERVRLHRRSVARKLASRIDFSKVSPSDLATVVEESGFVPLELMAMAYKTQAIAAERRGMKFGQMRAIELETNGRVIVQGAGLSAVNGTYVTDSTPSSMFRQYSKRGALPEFGGPGDFVLHTTHTLSDDDTKKWVLSFRCQSGTTCVDLYTAPVLFDEAIPPLQKWVSCSSAFEKLRRIASRSKLLQKKKIKSHQTNNTGESENGGDPPPICIWLPDEPMDR